MSRYTFTQENRLFSRLADMASYANLSPEDKLAYDADLKAYRDIMGQLSFAEARGIEKGIEKGSRREDWRLWPKWSSRWTRRAFP